VTAAFEAAEAALARHDLKAAETCAVQATRLAPKRPDVAALFAWVGAHSGDEDAVPESVRALTRILEEHPKCEPALYYRGMLLKRAGKDKAALRDFVMILYENPSHVNALNEVRELRKKKK
jgi:cytochrome c-type biogenesis protein CcmH/NrfG